METITKKLTLDGKPLTIHGISTGLVAVKERFRNPTSKGFLADLSVLLDKKFTEWMPIWVWVIEHPEGIFLIDTGEIAAVNNKDYFRSSGWYEHWLNRTQYKFKVARAEEIDQQLQQIGIPIEAITKVLLTHLHLDHMDGVKHFPNTDIYVNKRELDKPYGTLPKLYPSWFSPLSMELDEVYQDFEQAKVLTQHGDLIMVQTEGHTYGHSSFLLRTDEGYILFAGDVVYNQEQLRLEQYAGGTVALDKAKESYASIQRFGKKNKLIFLPSHDADAGTRLRAMQAL